MSKKRFTLTVLGLLWVLEVLLLFRYPRWQAWFNASMVFTLSGIFTLA